MLQKGLIPILFNDGLTPEYKAYKARVAADSGTLTIVSDKNFSDQIKSLKQTGVYDSASLICIPSGSKAGKLYSLKPTDGSGDFTVARNSIKWVRGKDGYYREAPANVPAMDWDEASQKFGVLVEPQVTNLCQKSFDFTNSYWTKTSSTIEGDLATTTTEHITSENNRSFNAGTIGDWMSITNGSGNISYDAEKGCGKIVVGSTPGTYNYARLYASSAMSNLITGDLVVVKADFYIPSTDVIGTYGVGITIRNAPGQEAASTIITQRDQWVTAYVFSRVCVVTDFYIDIRFNPGPQTAGNVLYFDNISVKKVQGFDCPFVNSTGVNLKRGFKLIATSANGYISLATALTITAATSYTNSIFVKRITGTGAVSLIDTNGTDREITVTSDWQRFSYTATSAGTTGQIGIRLATSGDEVMICQADVIQANVGSSPIFTDGATVTRLADVVSITDATILFGSKVGTIITEFIVNTLPADNTTRGIVFFRHPTENRYIGYYTYNSLLYANVVGGVTFQGTKSIATGRHIAALAFANNDIAFYLDGVQIATSSTATIADGIQLLLISQISASSTARLAGKIVKIVIDKTRLSNAKLQEITTL